MSIKLSESNSQWQTKIDTPCPLLLPCSDCKQLLLATDFYPSKRGRKTITGDLVLSVCKKCSIERYKKLDPRRKLYYGAKRRAKTDGHEFTIQMEDIVIPEFCPVFGIKIEDGTGTGCRGGGVNDNSASLDRIDNSKGYVPGNVAVISRRANRAKNDSSARELVSLLTYASKQGSLLSKADKAILAAILSHVEKD